MSLTSAKGPTGRVDPEAPVDTQCKLCKEKVLRTYGPAENERTPREARHENSYTLTKKEHPVKNKARQKLPNMPYTAADPKLHLDGTFSATSTP